MFENLDDPKRQALLALAAGLLSPVRSKGWSGFGEALGQGIQGGLLGFNQAQRTKEATDRGAMDRRLQQMRLEELERAQKFNQAAFKPGVGAQPLTPNDDNGFPMPSPAPRFDYQAASQIDPAKAFQMYQQFNPAPKDIVVGGRVVSKGPDGSYATKWEPPKDAPAPEKEPEAVRLSRIAQDATRPEFERVAARNMLTKLTTHQPATQVTFDTKQETEFSKEIGKQNAKDYADLMKSGAAAQSQQSKLSRLESLLSKSGNTGKLTPTTMELKAAAASFGINVDEKLPFQQAAQALSNEIALSLRNPAGGAGMPGALSDRDREFLQNMVPNLGKTPEGNKLIIETMKRLSKREAEVSRLAREYRQKTGRFDDGFYEVLAQQFGGKDLFGDIASKGGASAMPSLSDIEAEILRRRKGQ